MGGTLVFGFFALKGLFWAVVIAHYVFGLGSDS